MPRVCARTELIFTIGQRAIADRITLCYNIQTLTLLTEEPNPWQNAARFPPKSHPKS